jgi:hypothetical protein
MPCCPLFTTYVQPVSFRWVQKRRLLMQVLCHVVRWLVYDVCATCKHQVGAKTKVIVASAMPCCPLFTTYVQPVSFRWVQKRRVLLHLARGSASYHVQRTRETENTESIFLIASTNCETPRLQQNQNHTITIAVVAAVLAKAPVLLAFCFPFLKPDLQHQSETTHDANKPLPRLHNQEFPSPPPTTHIRCTHIAVTTNTNVLLIIIIIIKRIHSSCLHTVR